MLLPLGDDNTQRQSFPIVTILLIAANAVAFWYELQNMDEVVGRYSLIPAQFFSGGQPVWTVLISMFLHGGWAHLLGNMLYLYIFGDNVEDNLGKVKFLIFYLACGTAAMSAQALAMPSSDIPNIGASGAIAGVLAAYLILFPRNKVRVLIFFPFIAKVSAWFVLGLWIVMQLLSEYETTFRLASTGDGGIAYVAHIAGFFTGVVLTFVFRSRSAKQGAMDRLGMS